MADGSLELYLQNNNFSGGISEAWLLLLATSVTPNPPLHHHALCVPKTGSGPRASGLGPCPVPCRAWTSRTTCSQGASARLTTSYTWNASGALPACAGWWMAAVCNQLVSSASFAGCDVPSVAVCAACRCESNKFNGSLPSLNLGQTSIQELDFSNNMFTGSVSPSVASQVSLPNTPILYKTMW